MSGNYQKGHSLNILKNSIKNWGLVLNKDSIYVDNQYRERINIDSRKKQILAFDVEGTNWPISFHVDLHELREMLKECGVSLNIPIYKFSEYMMDKKNATNNLLFLTDSNYKNEIEKMYKKINKDKTLSEEIKQLLKHIKFVQTGKIDKMPKTDYCNLENGIITNNNRLL